MEVFIMSVSTQIFGHTKDGAPVTLYTISAADGSSISVMDYGATIVSLRFPDRSGQLQDCCLGYRDFSDYEEGGAFLGATCGPVCNRISGASFSINGEKYVLEANEGANQLHSASAGFDHKLFTLEHMEENSITFHYSFPDMEGGFPGNLSVSVTYTLTDTHDLLLSFLAQTDKDTPVNLTNHSYFNLSGEPDILDHILQINASRITQTGEGNIPTGNLLPVDGTVFDFTSPRKISEDIKKEEPALLMFGGYDHNFCIDGEGFRQLAVLASEKSGICMSIHSDLPGLQVYTGNFLSPLPGLDGKKIKPHGGIAMEPQFWPDAVNQESFPSVILRAGEVWNHRIEYRFRTL